MDLTRNQQLCQLSNTMPEKSVLLEKLYTYSIVPEERVKNRLTYFYGPYNGFYNMQKCMWFSEENEKSSMTPVNSNNW